MALALVVIAAGAGECKVASIVGIIADHTAERFGSMVAEPGLRNKMFQRRVTQGFAIGMHLQPRTAVNASGFPGIPRQHRLGVGLHREQEFSSKCEPHFTDGYRA